MIRGVSPVGEREWRGAVVVCSAVSGAADIDVGVDKRIVALIHSDQFTRGITKCVNMDVP